MCLTNEHVGPNILSKIKIYVLTRAELLFTLCYEIPCSWCTLYISTPNTYNPTYTQSPLIRTTAKLPTLGVLKNTSNLDAHWFLIPQV